MAPPLSIASDARATAAREHRRSRRRRCGFPTRRLRADADAGRPADAETRCMSVRSEELYRELRPPLSAEAAVVEADRCLECGGPYAEAPCVTACPADVDVPGFVAAIAASDPATAATTIFAENILGGTCARVCPVEVLCQRDCVLVHEGRAADRDRRAPALRDRVGLRERRPAAPAGAAEREARRSDRRRPGGLGCSRRARRARLRGTSSMTSARRSAGSSASRSRPTASRTSRCRTRRGCSRNSGSSSSLAPASTRPV